MLQLGVRTKPVEDNPQKLTTAKLVDTPTHFAESGSSLPCSQEPAIG
jgi:hypothetical protein